MKLVLRHQGAEIEVVGGDAGRVVSRAGTVHKAALRSTKTLCGMVFINYRIDPHSNSAEPDEEAAWPTSSAPVTCGRCLKIGLKIGYPGLIQPEGIHKDEVLDDLRRMKVDEAKAAIEARRREHRQNVEEVDA